MIYELSDAVIGLVASCMLHTLPGSAGHIVGYAVAQRRFLPEAHRAGALPSMA